MARRPAFSKFSNRYPVMMTTNKVLINSTDKARGQFNILVTAHGEPVNRKYTP